MTAGKKRRSGLTLILLALILIIGLGGAALFFATRVGNPTPTPVAGTLQKTPEAPTGNVVVLFQPIKRGAKITEGHVRVIPYNGAQGGSALFFSKLEDVVGKKRARYDLDAQTPLTQSLVVDDNGFDVSFNIPEAPQGLVAISIPINRLSAVAYSVMQGDHVYVIGSLLFVDLDKDFQTKLPNWTSVASAPSPGVLQQCAGQCYPAGQGLSIEIRNPMNYSSVQGRLESEPNLQNLIGAGNGSLMQYVIPSEFVTGKNNELFVQRPRLVSQTIVKDAVVMWVGDYSRPLVADQLKETPTPVLTPPTPVPAKGKEVAVAALPPPKPEVITIAVSPQEAVVLNYMMIIGSHLNLALRRSGEDPGKYEDTESVSLQYLLERYSIPYPAKLTYGTEPRYDNFNNITGEPKERPTSVP